MEEYLLEGLAALLGADVSDGQHGAVGVAEGRRRRRNAQVDGHGIVPGIQHELTIARRGSTRLLALHYRLNRPAVAAALGGPAPALEIMSMHAPDGFARPLSNNLIGHGEAQQVEQRLVDQDELPLRVKHTRDVGGRVQHLQHVGLFQHGAAFLGEPLGRRPLRRREHGLLGHGLLHCYLCNDKGCSNRRRQSRISDCYGQAP